MIIWLGAAIIMELWQIFQQYRPRRTMEFVWFGAEEKGLLGSRDYIRVHESELGAHRFNMNVDLAGQLIGGNVLGVTGEASVCDKLLEIADGAGIGASVKNQIWGSDSNSFAWKGIPAMTLNRDGFGMHTRYDTIDLLSAWSLERSAILLGCIADELGNAEVSHLRERCRRNLSESWMNICADSKNLILSAHNWIFVMELWGLVCFGKSTDKSS